MASPQDSVSMAVFCDFENVALGVRDAKFEKFDIKPVLERLLLKGSIVVKKAYCDWDRYKGFKASMHEASFELIEIPHVRQSGKNSADIRLVVDALDLCYTKSHVDTFVIISGDSDFSPLVSKLRENAKKVIGVGVKNSTSDLLVANCDEFIFYDDLVREQQRENAKREAREASVAAKRAADEDKQPKAEMEARKAKAIAIAVETFDALATERGESGKIWASVLKSAIKRRKPDFSESYYGFRAFGNLLDEAQARGLLEVGRDDKSGAFVFRPSQTAAPDVTRQAAGEPAFNEHGASADAASGKARKKSKSGRKQGREQAPAAPSAGMREAAPDIFADATTEPLVTAEARSVPPEVPGESVEPAQPKPRRARKTPARKAARTDVAGTDTSRGTPATDTEAQPQAPATSPALDAPPVNAKPAKPAKAPRKSAPRASRSRKIAVENTGEQ
jgi:uncharacterized protein (TIGR00288 family)